ncbi:signal peptide peptidase SppA [Spongiibacter sp. KMU-158]|uniref:Signal peptide peptidase SppA n=1 Tax=Spongiibacter pelagi TaxID=2760804 RepID=A0A927BZW6_9GAMM|nr:signal peptide peptidase SppA [Spongiibacter pelagi]MBD2858674.1 signal peptide peptidase SppA [Spongiibacter pelagi]
MSSKRGLFSRIGSLIDGLRRLVLNLLFLGFIGVFIFALMQDSPLEIPEKAILVVAPDGVVVEQYTAVDAVTQLSGSGPKETRLRDLIEAIDRASLDPRIKGVLLRLHHLDHIGMSKTWELAQALERFRESGKSIVAVSDYYDQDQYLLAAQADKIYLEPMGGVALEGFAVVRNYFREAIQRLKIRFHIFRVGTYKSALEPLIRDDMSPEDKEANRGWLEPLWAMYRGEVLARRNISETQFDAFTNRIDQVMAKYAGNAEQAAIELGLVDKVLSRAQLRDEYAPVVGVTDGYFNQVHYQDYLFAERTLYQEPQGAVGIIVAQGNIVDGEASAGGIGGDSLARLIRQTAEDKTVKAVVLRIDSGGGSAMASEVIRQELQALKATGKPLVVSMSSAAASGGYWIAADADRILATPATLTGSIGIFGAFPTFENLLEHFGVYTDGVGTTDIAGAMRVDKPLSPVLERAMQSGIENGYQRFLKVVADGRSMAMDEVDELAQGRVWSGVDAQRLGLVDALGSLAQAVDVAAELAGVSAENSRVLRLPLSPEEELLEFLLHQGLVKSALGQFAFLDRTIQWLFQPAGLVKQWQSLNDPRGMYAFCGVCLAP